MINETETINQLIQKLIEIGYSESDLQANTSTKYDRGVDLVVYESSKPKIVFEVKTSSLKRETSSIFSKRYGSSIFCYL
jgi:hypothetical protein